MFKEFGIRLNFTPTIAGDVIRLKVRPEVSTLDFANGITLSGLPHPGADHAARRDRRRAAGRPDVRDRRPARQRCRRTTTPAIPLLSKLPIIGALFKSKAEARGADRADGADHAAPGPAAGSRRGAAAADEPGHVHQEAGRPVKAGRRTGERQRPARGRRRARRCAAAGPPKRKPSRARSEDSHGQRPPRSSQRGAVLIHVAIALLGLMAFSTFVARLRRHVGQPRPGADGRGCGGAVRCDLARVRQRDRLRRAPSRRREPSRCPTPSSVRRPTSSSTDVTFPACPPGAPGSTGHLRQGGRLPQSGAGQSAADVFRNDGRRDATRACARRRPRRS